MKKNNKRIKKIRNLVFVCIFAGILLTVSTYAWFIGMQTVRVNSFEVKIAATDGLMLSLDGETWTTELDTTTATQYTGHTNQWLTEKDGDGKLISQGLIPMSSVGDINSTSSRLRLFEKGSLTATNGGYRVLTSEVINTGAKESDGYVAFDLFIRNMSGEKYYSSYDVNNEEAIYLTYDSDVTVGTSGTQNTGIENSVRVAFAQIGRVENQEYKTDDENYPVTTVTGITCKTEGAVTGICSRTATIWEPNDKNHITNAISWYDESCSLREDGTADTHFKYTAKTSDDDTHCSGVTNNTYYPTYAISREIAIADYVDLYDGLSFNKYSKNTVEPTPEDDDDRVEGVTYFDTYASAKAGEGFNPSNYKLVAADTFTETERDLTGASRKVFMTLAPNSITKVRVYVYIEGQDIDNYDFAQLGKAIQVNFGFTKERYTTEDYTDEPVSVIPGSETATKIPYAPATNAVVSDVVEGEGVVMVWDEKTNAFYHHKEDTVTEFTFKETVSNVTTNKKASYAEGKWTFETVAG